MSSATINEARADRLNDELERDAPVALGTDDQVLGNNYLTLATLRPLQLRRSIAKDGTGRLLYEIGPAYFESLPFSYNGKLLDKAKPFHIPPNTRVYARARIYWDRTTVRYQEAVFGTPPVVTRTSRYKNGAYAVLSAEIITVPVGITPADHTEAPGINYPGTDFIPPDEPETQHFLLGTVLANGAVDPVSTPIGTIVAGGSFRLFRI